MRKMLSLLLVFILLLPPVIVSAAEDEPIKAFLDGQQLSFDVDPIVSNNTTLVQYTTVFKALGMKYSWEQVTKTVTGYNDYVLMNLTIGNQIALVNNKEVKMAAAARAVNGRTLVPLRFVSEATGAQVVWNKEQRTVTITSAPTRDELPLIMRDHSWDASQASVKAIEPAKLSLSKEGYLLYEAVDLAGYPAHLAYYFYNDKLEMIDYELDVEAEHNDDYLVAVAILYMKLEKLFGEPYIDELYFYDASNYHEDTDRFADSIAAGEADIMTIWQAGYTKIRLWVTGTDDGGIMIQLHIENTK